MRMSERKKPGPVASENTARVSTNLTEEQRDELVKLMAMRRIKDPRLPLRWSLADYLREIVAEHLAAQRRKK